MEKDKKIVLEELAKYLLDISKLVFGGVILSGIMDQGLNPWLLYGVGISVTTISAYVGFKLYGLINKR